MTTAVVRRPPDGHEQFLAPQERERTPWLLAALCLLIPLLPSYAVPPGPLKSYGSPAKVLAVLLLVLMFLGFVFVKRTAGASTIRPGVILILIYFALVLITYGMGLTLTATQVVTSTRSRTVIIVMANVGIALYAMVRVTTVRQRSIVLGCLAFGLTYSCLVGLLQSTTNIDLRLLFQPPGFVVNTVTTARTNATGVNTSFTERLGARRVYGTSAHPIEFTVLAAATVPLTLHLARYANSRQTRLFAGVAVLIALLALPAGVSRSGVVALFVALLLYVWTFSLRGIAIAAVAAAVALAAEFAVSPRTIDALWKTITNSAGDDSVLSRVAGYAKVSETLRESPWYGLGLGGSPAEQYGYLDNEWMQAIVQGGFIGLAAMALLAVGGVVGIAAALRRATNRRERDQAYAVGAMFVGILSSSYTFDLFSFQQATLVYFLLFGLLWSTFSVKYPPGPTAEIRREPEARRWSWWSRLAPSGRPAGHLGGPPAQSQ